MSIIALFQDKEKHIGFTKHLHPSYSVFDSNLLLYPVFPRSTVILEVKFNGFLLEYIKNFIDNIEKSEL